MDGNMYKGGGSGYEATKKNISKLEEVKSFKVFTESFTVHGIS